MRGGGGCGLVQALQGKAALKQAALAALGYTNGNSRQQQSVHRQAWHSVAAVRSKRLLQAMALHLVANGACGRNYVHVIE